MCANWEIGKVYEEKTSSISDLSIGNHISKASIHFHRVTMITKKLESINCSIKSTQYYTLKSCCRLKLVYWQQLKIDIVKHRFYCIQTHNIIFIIFSFAMQS